MIVLWRAGLRISEALALAEKSLIVAVARSSCAAAAGGGARGCAAAFAPHQLRQAPAVEMAREEVPRWSSSSASSGTANLAITSIYLQGIDSSEIID